MTNLIHTSEISKPPSRGKSPPYNLDTLEQPRNAHNSQTVTADKNILLKRAQAKYFTNSVVYRLISLDSPIKKAYWSTYHCAETIIQDDQKLTSKYCGKRWCSVCNRIRTANLVNGYLPKLLELKNPYFVTLTIPNIKAETVPELEYWFKKMYIQLRRISEVFRKSRDFKLLGLRKFECTYNPIRDDFHPHFHMIVENADVISIGGRKTTIAEEIIREWLERFPDANRQAQDNKPCTPGSTKELFKYFTKTLSRNKHTGRFEFHAEAMDKIFRAMHKKRIFQPMGIKKVVSEEIDEIYSEVFDFVEKRFNTWYWNNEANDWIDPEGECLTSYKPSEALRKIVYDLRSLPP